LLLAFVATISVACGGSERPAQGPSPGASASASNVATVPAARKLLDAIDPEAHVAVHVDVAKLTATPLYKALSDLLHKFGSDTALDEANRQCGFSIPDKLSEVVFSARDNEYVFAASFSVSPEQALACVRTLGKVSDVQLDDGTKAMGLAGGSDVAFIKDGILFGGNLAAVRRAVAGAGGKSALAAAVALSGDAVIALRADDESGFKGKDAILVTVRANDSEFSVDSELTTEAAEDAAKLAAVIQSSLSKLNTLEHSAVAEGRILRLHIGAKGGVAEQVSALGTASVLAISAARKYMAEAKSAEAALVVNEIAKDLSSSVAREKTGNKGARFPKSAAPVPAEVPHGQKYQSAAADWSATWKEIGFSMTEPQYFRYSIVTAPDKKHAVVRAEGDLNGDGKTSLYEMALEIDKKGDVKQGTMKVVAEP
jgi:hypothetical protein